MPLPPVSRFGRFEFERFEIARWWHALAMPAQTLVIDRLQPPRNM